MPNKSKNGYLFLKRVFDIFASIFGLVIFSPLLLATAIAVKVTSPGPIIFKQQRFGRDRVPFMCYKFRSMLVDTPDCIPTALMQENPEVLTPIGAFIRRASLDELPQMVNILKGEMSFIGPRPMILAECEQIELREPYHANDICPGLTGWAQVNGRDAVTMEEKAVYDGEYCNRMSIAFDIKIFLKSIVVVLWKLGYAETGNQSLSSKAEAESNLLHSTNN